MAESADKVPMGTIRKILLAAQCEHKLTRHEPSTQSRQLRNSGIDAIMRHESEDAVGHIAMLGTGLIGGFYTMTLHSLRAPDG